MVLWSFQAFNQLKEANFQAAAAEATFRGAEQNLLLRVAQAYFGILSASDQLATNRSEREAFGTLLNQATVRQQTGVGPRSDVAQAQAFFDATEQSIIDAQNALDDANLALTEIVGPRADRIAPLRDDIPLSAVRARVGRFELANGGTLFLDEIGNLPLAGQVKLLRVLETGQFEMLGSSRSRSSRVRVLSATNADLPALIRTGTFREDLYYRLNVIEIALPPLTERRADILPLARHFLGVDLQLSEDAAAALLAHDWPGNVRELRNSMERAKLMARDGIVNAADLKLPPATRAAAESDASRGGSETVVSRELLESALRGAGGNVSRAAQSLGLSRQALYRRMERFNMRPPGGA